RAQPRLTVSEPLAVASHPLLTEITAAGDKAGVAPRYRPDRARNTAMPASPPAGQERGCPVVGLGASAGGLAASETFLRAMAVSGAGRSSVVGGSTPLGSAQSHGLSAPFHLSHG